MLDPEILRRNPSRSARFLRSRPQGPGYQGAAEPAADLKALDKLVGTWELSGDVGGTVTYEWLKGGFLLIQRVNMVQEDDQENTGIEIIGHERDMGAEPSADIKSRFYSDSGDTSDYVYELEGDTLTIWFGERGSPAYYEGTLSADGRQLVVVNGLRLCRLRLLGVLGGVLGLADGRDGGEGLRAVEDRLDVVVTGIPDVGGVVALGVLRPHPWRAPVAAAVRQRRRLKASTASRLGASNATWAPVVGDRPAKTAKSSIPSAPNATPSDSTLSSWIPRGAKAAR